MAVQGFVQEYSSNIYEYASVNLPPFQFSFGNLAAYFLNILVNYLSSSGVLGKSNADLSSANETPITPAGWTFAIWGLIFLLEGVGSIFGVLKFDNQILKSKRYDSVTAIGHGWQLGWLFQCLWQFLFLIQTPFANFICAVVLCLAFVSFLVSTINLWKIDGLNLVTKSPVNYISYQLPTSINAAWLNIAFPLGVIISIKSFGLQDWASLSYISTLILAIIVAGGTCVTTVQKDIAYSLALIWGIQGIKVKQAENKLIYYTSLIGQLVLVIGVVYQVVNQIIILKNPSLYQRLNENVEQVTGEL